MKRSITGMIGIASIMLMAMGMAACGDKRNNNSEADEAVALQMAEDLSNVVVELNEFHVNGSVNYNGHEYAYTIERLPQDSVIVVDEEGYKSRDNSIILTIQRDGANFFQRRFTRSAFHIRIDDSYYKQCILLGMNFDRTTEYGLRFIASIGKGSDSEDYKPYSVTIGPDGSTDITEHDLYEDDEVSRFEDEGV